MHRVTLRRASGECGTVLQCIDRCCSASIIFLSINPRSLFLFCFGCLALAPFVMFEQVAGSLSHNRDLDIILSILYLCSALTAVSAFPLPFPSLFPVRPDRALLLSYEKKATERDHTRLYTPHKSGQIASHRRSSQRLACLRLHLKAKRGRGDTGASLVLVIFIVVFFVILKPLGILHKASRPGSWGRSACCW